MMRLPELRLVLPRTLSEASRLLADPGAAALAGGTDLLPKLKRRQIRARTLVDLSAVKGFSGIVRRDGRVVVGAGTRIADLIDSPALAGFAALREAAASIATPQIRAAATVGGNLALDTRCVFYDHGDHWRRALGFCLKTDASTPCRAAPGSDRCFAAASGDLAPALVALEAEVLLIGPRGERALPLADLYKDDGRSPLRLDPGELIAAVELAADGPQRSTYRKLRRRGSFDFAAVGVAVALRMRAREIESCRIALGGLSSAPVVAEEAGRLLEGAAPTAERIAAAAAAAVRRARPVDNSDFPAAYRRRMAGVFVSRALSELTGTTRSTNSA